MPSSTRLDPLDLLGRLGTLAGLGGLGTLTGLGGLGPLALLAACGPVAPQFTTGDASDSGDTDIADTDDPPQPTGDVPDPPEPTAPMPGCDGSSDCSELYCGYCEEGICREGVGCCGDAPARPDIQRLRCGQSYQCYDDVECSEGYECEFGECIPGVTTRLPPCDAQDFLPQQWNLGSSPGAFALADFDADGDLDLAAALPGVGEVQLALNDGAGGFTLASAVSVGGPAPALSLVAADLDADLAVDDLAVLRRNGAGGLILLFGQDALFTPQPPLTTTSLPVTLLATRDPDNDLTDLLIVGPDEVRTRPGPTYASEIVVIGETLDHRARLVDINRDGPPDLIASLPGTTTIGTWIAGPDRSFSSLVFVDPHVEHALTLAGDLDQTPVPIQDDLSALIFARTIDTGGEIEVWALVNDPGGLAAPIRFTTSVPITGGHGVDVGAPAGLDIVATTGQPSVLLVLGDAVGGFACERVIPTPAVTTADLLVAADLNNDTRVDLVVGDPDSPTVTVLLAP